jgi:hypothetical protein
LLPVECRALALCGAAIIPIRLRSVSSPALGAIYVYRSIIAATGSIA